jgi:broad specificity phosphatase PhoE
MTGKPGPAAVWLYRHGPLAIPPFQCVGWTDVPLADAAQTAIEARRLAPFVEDAAAIFASDLLRTRQTAAPLAAALELPLQTEPELRELNFGEWEGKLWNELRDTGDPVFLQFAEDWSSTRAPGGESFVDVGERVGAFWKRIAAEHAGSVVVVVSHGGTLAALSMQLLGWSSKHAMKSMLERGHFGYIDFARGGYAWNLSPTKLPTAG